MEYPKAYEIYRHFKGNLYMVICIAEDCDDLSKKVVYKALYGEGKTYVRDLEEFLSEVDHDKYPYIEQKSRFKKITPEKLRVQDDITTNNNAKTDNSKNDDSKTDDSMSNGDNNNRESDEKDGDDSKNVSPLIRFLDTNDNDERLEILTDIQDELTEDMCSTMEFVLGMEEGTGSVFDRYRNIKQNIIYKSKYEKKSR